LWTGRDAPAITKSLQKIEHARSPTVAATADTALVHRHQRGTGTPGTGWTGCHQ
jgi:hypothetical protein